MGTPASTIRAFFCPLFAHFQICDHNDPPLDFARVYANFREWAIVLIILKGLLHQFDCYERKIVLVTIQRLLHQVVEFCMCSRALTGVDADRYYIVHSLVPLSCIFRYNNNNNNITKAS